MRKLTIQVALVACLVTLLTACGEQSKQYASSKVANAYFTAPNGWREISNETLTKFERKNAEETGSDAIDTVIWQTAFTPIKNLKLAQVYSIESLAKPLVVVRVRTLKYEERQGISFDKMRSIVLPVQSWLDAPDDAPDGFKLIDDYEVVDQGVRGIRTIYTVDDDGVSQTFDQVVLVTEDKNIVYILLNRCNTECYNANQKEIDEIVTSFTVKGKK